MIKEKIIAKLIRVSSINMTRKLCDIINPIFIENIVRGIDCQHDQGYINKEYRDLLRSQMEDVAKLCKIIPENTTFGTYKKEEEK